MLIFILLYAVDGLIAELIATNPYIKKIIGGD